MKLSSLSLPNKIALTVFLLICGGLGPLVLYSTVTLQSNLQKLVSDQQFAYVSFVANDLEQKVKLRTQSLQDVADHLPSDKIKDRDAVNQYLESRLAIYRMFTNGVVVIDRDGFGVADHPHIDNRDTGDFREREFFKEVLATGKPAIGKPRLGRFTKRLGIGLAVPIRDRDGVIVGVMAGFMGLTDNSIFDQAKAKLGKTGEYVLVSINDRTIIVDTDNSHTLQPVNAPGEDLSFDRFMSGFEGTAITKHFHIGEALTSANNILDGRWLLLGALPIEEAFAPIVALEKQIYEVAAGILLAIVGLMCWLVQRLLKPLARATSRISKMDSDGEQQLVLPVESDDEVGKLVKTFNKLHQSLHLSRLELQNQAHTDFLTGLANRRHFLELAELEVTRSIRYGSPLAAFMLDIDLFKKVNDTYGHKVGDLVLKRLSGIVLEALREVDVAGRFGGEEFAILLPETDGKQAVEVAERLRQLVESTPVILENGLPLKFTVSIGISSFAGKETNIDTLLNLADQALYKAKNSGRNKVVMEGQ